MLDLLLQTQNLLRKRVDFDILLVNLLRQAEELGASEFAAAGAGLWASAWIVSETEKRRIASVRRRRVMGQAWHLRRALASWRRFAFRVHSR